MPEVPFRFYSELDNIFITRQQIISQRFPLEIKLIEAIIERHFHYIEVLSLNLASNAIKKGIQMTGIEPFPALYFQRNTHYLYGCFSLLKSGLPNQATSILRTVFETILETYIILLDLTVAELPKKYLSKISEEDKQRNVSDLLFYYKTENLDEEKKILLKRLQHLSPSLIRQTLYTETQKNKIDIFYHNLSQMSHANITGMMSEIELNLNDVLDKMKLLMALGISNLIVISEAHSNDIEYAEKVATDKLINTIEGYLRTLPDLIPDKPEHREKLTIKLSSSNETQNQ